MFNKTSLEMAEKDLELLLWPSKLYQFLFGVEQNVTFLLEGALLGKEFLLNLSNFVLLFNMHNLLEQLKMQKKDIIVSRQFSQALLCHLF